MFMMCWHQVNRLMKVAAKHNVKKLIEFSLICGHLTVLLQFVNGTFNGGFKSYLQTTVPTSNYLEYQHALGGAARGSEEANL